MDISLVGFGINLGLLVTGLGLGYKIGYSHSSSKIVTEMVKPCSILFENNKRTWKEPTVYYHGDRPFTNNCEALRGKRCLYNDKKCHLL